MSTLTGYLPLPPFPAGAQLDVTGLLDRLENNTAILEALTRRGRDALCAHAYPSEPYGQNPHALGQWSVIFRTDAPTLTIKTRKTAGDTGCTMRVRVKVTATTTATAGTFTPVLNTDETHTYNLASTPGISPIDGQVVLVELELYDESVSTPELADGETWGRLEVTAIYTGDLADLTELPAWPGGGVPTFTDTLDPALLEQLAACLNHVAYRVAIVPRPLFTSLAHATGLFYLDDSNNPIDQQIWRGGITRGSMDDLRLEGRYKITTNEAETLRLFVNGTLVAETDPLAAGQSGTLAFDVSLATYGATDPLRLELRSRVSDVPVSGQRPSRYSLYRVWTESDAAAEALPTAAVPLASITWATLKARLNALGAVVEACYDRVQAAPDIYGRCHAFRRNYGYSTFEKDYYETRHVPLQQRRAGSRLVVCGVGPVKLCYGSATWGLVNDTEPDGTYTLTNTYEETVIEGDQLITVVVNLDNYPGLTVDTAYILRGDVRGAWEYL